MKIKPFYDHVLTSLSLAKNEKGHYFRHDDHAHITLQKTVYKQLQTVDI
jgi:hypothetical protein